jgi:hypothetical protein
VDRQKIKYIDGARMKTRMMLVMVVVLATFGLVGCTGGSNGIPTANSNPQARQDSETTTEQKAAIAKLSVEDQPLAEAQGYCAVTSEPLGSMGPPIKLVLNEKTVFVCCKGCEKKAKANLDKTLAKVAELKARVKSERSH